MEAKQYVSRYSAQQVGVRVIQRAAAALSVRSYVPRVLTWRRQCPPVIRHLSIAAARTYVPNVAMIAIQYLLQQYFVHVFIFYTIYLVYCRWSLQQYKRERHNTAVSCTCSQVPGTWYSYHIRWYSVPANCCCSRSCSSSWSTP